MGGMTPKEMAALDVQDVAQLLGVSDRMVRNYANGAGIPFTGDGRGRRFDWSAVLAWYVDYQINLRGSRGSAKAVTTANDPASITLEQIKQDLRKTTAEADRLELKLAQERGDVVAIGDVQSSVEKVASALKTAILSWPQKLTPDLTRVKDRGAVRGILDKAARELCRQLAVIGKQSAPAPKVTDDDI